MCNYFSFYRLCERPNSILPHLAGAGPSAGACWQIRQLAMPKIMPDAHRDCLQACPVLWPRFQKKPLLLKCAPVVALICHSLNLGFWRGWHRKKGTTALSHSL